MKAPHVELLLKNGTIVDGSGSAPFTGNVAVSDGFIVAIGDTGEVTADLELDVTGKVISPGFIDAHSHDDHACIRDPDMTAKISQGVTTVVVGNCGLSIAPLQFVGTPEEPFNLLGDSRAFSYPNFEAYTHAINEARPSVNVVTLVGHTMLRRLCMFDLTLPASASELTAMIQVLKSALKAGAAGLSSGVYYPPAKAADLNEMTALAKVVSQFGGVYATHIRDEYDGVAEALEEAFATTRSAQTPLIISHHKCAGMHNWGRSRETLALIDEAMTHQPVGIDCYPYTAGSSVLNPELCDGEIDVLISSSDLHPEAAGRRLADIAFDWGLNQREAAIRLVPGFACYFQIHEDDMRRILAHPECMVGSDGLPNGKNPHPRLWGTFPRVLGRYARDLKLFSLTTAVAKMTGLPARRFGLSDRGRIATGLVADLTVFDPQTVIDNATFEDPIRVSSGVAEVFVRGVHTWSEGRVCGRAGGFLARTNV